MATVVNQCMLSQTDFDFISKSNLALELTDSLTTIEFGLNLNMILTVLFFIVGIMLIVFSVMIRHRAKVASNLFIGMVIIGCLILGFGIVKDLNSIQSIETEIAEVNTELEAIAVPDAALFEACSKADSVVTLAPNRDDVGFESRYEPIIITKKP